MSEPSRDHLDALARVDSLLAERAIDYWLFGGWAVDFHVGSVSRAHDDVDIAVWLDDVQRIAELLEGEGWRHAPEPDEDGGTGYDRDGVRLELTFLVRDGDGRVCTPFAHGLGAWPDGTFVSDVLELEGVRARVISRTSLTHGKSSSREDPADTAKDRADFERLAGIVEVRPAKDRDRHPLALLFAAVADERDGIAAEPPIDVEARAASWDLERTLVAVAAGEVVGVVFVVETSFGFGELGMMVAADWRGRGVGTALVASAIEWARARGLHKLSLGVFPHNEAALALYRKFGFLEEGRRLAHIRRANGELWDLIEMGLPL